MPGVAFAQGWLSLDEDRYGCGGGTSTASQDIDGAPVETGQLNVAADQWFCLGPAINKGILGVDREVFDPWGQGSRRGADGPRLEVRVPRIDGTCWGRKELGGCECHHRRCCRCCGNFAVYMLENQIRCLDD